MADAVNASAADDGTDAGPLPLLLPLALTLMSIGFPLTECPFPFERATTAIPASPPADTALRAPIPTTMGFRARACFVFTRPFASAPLRFDVAGGDPFRAERASIAFAWPAARARDTVAALPFVLAATAFARLVVRDSGAGWTLAGRFTDRLVFIGSPATRFGGFAAAGDAGFARKADRFAAVTGGDLALDLETGPRRPAIFPTADLAPVFAFFAVRRGAGIAVLTSVSDLSAIGHISRWADVMAAI